MEYTYTQPSQSEPTMPSTKDPQINISKPKGPRADAELYMKNEHNTYVSILTGCILLIMSIYLPIVMQSPSLKWAALGLSVSAFVIIIQSLIAYKRNFEAFESNEQKYIEWGTSHIFLYFIGSVMLITSLMISYELYWNASRPQNACTPSSGVEHSNTFESKKLEPGIDNDAVSNGSGDSRGSRGSGSRGSRDSL